MHVEDHVVPKAVLGSQRVEEVACHVGPIVSPIVTAIVPTLARLCSLSLAAGLALLIGGCGLEPPVEAEQPIAYNHKVHIEAELECSRCHRGAEDQEQAGLPPVQTCASCHRRVASDHPEVQKVLQAWEDKTPIEWVKMNHLPESAMVQFHHGAHTRAEIACEECHGDVASMALQVPPFDVADMGWCVTCHRENADKGASDDCLTCHF